MNERIRELADQAELTIRTSTGTYMSHPEFNKKFAELLVKECVKILSNESERLYALSTDGGDDFDICAEKCLDNMLVIKEHFGVEE